ncbi:MAG: cobyric acid synthase [Lachnospiraceae bacterium]|nr:cobyric acid synthase [Lachnospiraceae bacterium]
MAKKLMIQGTMSNSGKSFLVAALCRIFRQDGYRVAPFKSQNMALNSYITKDGLEIGRAQAMQAEAAGIAPTVDMNPILLKPTSQMGSQVIVNGEVYGNLKAMEYYRRKPEFIPVIREAFARLEEQYDIIVLEGAGSPAEINLRDNDIVNMGMAKLADAPVLLVGDIDRGGVFASLYGTVSLLEPEEQARIKGLLINKFRGDVKILELGLRMIEERLHIPVLGVIPMEQIDLDDEDSLSDRLSQVGSGQSAGDASANGLDIAVIHLPHISNFTDFNALEQFGGVALRYVNRAAQLGKPDLILLPGTKNTMADLAWLRESGLEAAIAHQVSEKIPLIGICGGYQMLGERLADPEQVEHGGTMRGMGLLPAETIFASRKTRTQIQGVMQAAAGMYAEGAELPVVGYEIHMGVTRLCDVPESDAQGSALTSALAPASAHPAMSSTHPSATPAILLEDGRLDGLVRDDGLVFGSYLHGLFDNEAWTEALLSHLAKKKGISLETTGESRKDYKERQYDKLADLVRSSLDLEAIYRLMEE